jgi:hypothetical protein
MALGSMVDPVVITGWPLVSPIVTAMGLVSGRSWGQAYGVCGGSHSHRSVVSCGSCGERSLNSNGPHGHSCGVSCREHSQGCGLWQVL